MSTMIGTDSLTAMYHHHTCWWKAKRSLSKERTGIYSGEDVNDTRCDSADLVTVAHLTRKISNLRLPFYDGTVSGPSSGVIA